MKYQLFAVLSLSVAAVSVPVTSAAMCSNGVPVNVSGKITNNAQPGGAFSTLGVVAMKVDGIGKMKCGLVSQPQTSEIPPEQGGVAFEHTISCDDQVAVYVPPFGELVAHSQLTLDTQGVLSPQFCNGVDPSHGVYGSFREVSTPKTVFGNSTGRGIFTGVTEGQIVIDGELNCIGSVDMTFEGHVCMAAQ